MKCVALAFAWIPGGCSGARSWEGAKWKHVRSVIIAEMDQKGIGVKRTLVCCGTAPPHLKDKNSEDCMCVTCEVTEVKPGIMVGAWKHTLGRELSG